MSYAQQFAAQTQQSGSSAPASVSFVPGSAGQVPDETVIDLIKRGYDLRPIGVSAHGKSPVRDRNKATEHPGTGAKRVVTPTGATAMGKSPRPATRSSLTPVKGRMGPTPTSSGKSPAPKAATSSGNLRAHGDAAKTRSSPVKATGRNSSAIAANTLRKGSTVASSAHSDHLEQLQRHQTQLTPGLTSPRPDVPLMTQDQYYQLQLQQQQEQILRLQAEHQATLAKTTGGASSSPASQQPAVAASEEPSADLTSQAATPSMVIPESIYKQMFLQERADRFHVERLFLEREEHHGRLRVSNDESYRIVELVTAARHLQRASSTAVAHESELAALQKKLEDETSVTSVRKELQHATTRVHEERRAVEQLQNEMRGKEEDRHVALDEDRQAWSAEKSGLLKQLHVLEKQVTAASSGGHLRSGSGAPSAGMHSMDYGGADLSRLAADPADHSAPRATLAVKSAQVQHGDSMEVLRKQWNEDRVAWKVEREAWLREKDALLSQVSSEAAADRQLKQIYGAGRGGSQDTSNMVDNASERSPSHAVNYRDTKPLPISGAAEDHTKLFGQNLLGSSPQPISAQPIAVTTSPAPLQAAVVNPPAPQHPQADPLVQAMRSMQQDDAMANRLIHSHHQPQQGPQEATTVAASPVPSAPPSSVLPQMGHQPSTSRSPIPTSHLHDANATPEPASQRVYEMSASRRQRVGDVIARTNAALDRANKLLA